MYKSFSSYVYACIFSFWGLYILLLAYPNVVFLTTGEVKPRIGRNPESLWSFLPCCLAHLNIRSCSLSDEAFPKDFGHLHSLEFLGLSKNPIRGLPHCVRGLRGLVQLVITQCYSLQTLEGLLRVTNLAVVDCSLLERITFQSSLCVPIELLSMHNPKLVEIEYLYKFVPIARCDAETIKLLGLCSLKFKGITIRMLFPSRNSIFDEVYKYHIQVILSLSLIYITCNIRFDQCFDFYGMCILGTI